MFEKILIANRGEIACRVMRTAKRMGIRTVAVFSDADAHARHVELADEARHIGAAPARESYLSIERILAAARASGAQAIHPGYGFLSENDRFADACTEAGIVFIGPPASAIRAMGSKSAAKALMQTAGVPLVPGYHGAEQDPEFLLAQAAQIGFPVLIKASAGGGGKGMRIVRAQDQFIAALASCQRESINAFGDDRVLIERYLEQPRHIEIQLFADTHGNAVYLFERDCSVQRRHQKVLEEAPAPGMTPERRARMGEAAVAAARAIGYVGAGTVEFIADQAGTFHFMEMNTRLQVEHPVTEMITGQDLVEWQLRVAAGERLPRLQPELAIHGHAIEARIYAEDPARNFLPSTGRLQAFLQPAESTHVRVDTGVRTGDTITPFYDPMIAKLIVWDQDRDRALARMRTALAGTMVVGPQSNVGFLERLIASAAFANAQLDTGLIERHQAELLPAPSTASMQTVAVAAGAEALHIAAQVRQAAARSGDPHSPWHEVDGWQLNAPRRVTLRFKSNRADIAATIRDDGASATIEGLTGMDTPLAFDAQRAGDHVQITLGERVIDALAVRTERAWHIAQGGTRDRIDIDDPAFRELNPLGARTDLNAPMPGKVVSVLVAPGVRVERGTPLLVLEAMKMEHTICAPAPGLVRAIPFAAGEQVAEGAELVQFDPDPAPK